MGGSASRHLLPACLRPAAADGGDDASAPPIVKDPLEEALGHSFCYVRSAATPGHSRSSSLSSDVAAAVTTAASFKSISGAAVSANSTCPQPVFDNAADADDGDLAAGGGREIAARHRPPGFRSSASFSALPLQLSSSASASGSLDRGFFLSGPIESGALSGPLDGPSTTAALPFSGPLARRSRRRTASGGLRRASLFRRSLSERNRPWVVPLRSLRREASVSAPQPAGCLQWAQGKAGEDRVHIVVSEEHHWLFIGIYDGFNGPEAPEFLVSNLYRSVFDELRGLFWEEAEEHASDDTPVIEEEEEHKPSRRLWEFLQEESEHRGLEFAGSGRFAFSLSKLRNGLGSWRKDGSWNWFPRWRYDSDDKAKVALDRPKGRRRQKAGPVGDHQLVLRALSRALELTELAYLEMTDRAMNCNPEVAVMGSCLLVALMRDDDVYVMNVGDSRAIVAQYRPQEMVHRRTNGGVEMHLAEDTLQGVESVEVDLHDTKAVELGALQLSTDHSTSIEEEVLRIRKEHPDDNHCIVNDRVKGRLKVTRAFGAGYLKQDVHAPLLGVPGVKFVVIAVFIACAFASIVLCTRLQPGLEQKIVLPQDSYLQDYFDDLAKYLKVGPPLYFVVKDFNYSSESKESNQICSINQCDSNSLLNEITKASLIPESSYIAKPAASWLDDFLIWLSPEAFSCCRKFVNDSYCPPDDQPPCCQSNTGSCGISSICKDCTTCFRHTDLHDGRPSTAQFKEKLPWFLNALPSSDCAKGGKGAYTTSLDLTGYDSGIIEASSFRTYHTPVNKQSDFVNALRAARDFSSRMSNALKMEIFPYSVFYIFFEQYLDIWKTALINISLGLGAVLVVCLVITCSLWTSAIILVVVAMIVLDMMGMMALLDIQLNAVSVVNLVMSIGIAVEFCVHITHAFSVNNGDRETRAKAALATMGASVFSGITLTKLVGVIVLRFAKSEVFVVYYFKMYLALVLIGFLHGLVFLPVVLSICGPPSRCVLQDSQEDQPSTSAEPN